VLEDNLRVPSGVSYMLEDRKMMMRLFPELFSPAQDRTGRALPGHAARQPAHASRRGVSDPTVVVLTPGAYNSAYFEHTFLAQQMGVELVEGRTCSSRRHGLHAHDAGPAARRRDLPPHRRRLPRPAGLPPDSMLGVPGLLSAYRAGRVTLANAIGTGVADDKSIYPYVPEMIRFYLGEEPILNNVPTWHAAASRTICKYVLEHLPNWWSRKCTAPAATACWSARRRASRDRAFRARIIATPENYIAQPTLALSNCPTFVERASRRATSTCAPSCCPARSQHGARRPDARGAEGRLAGGQLVAGRRHQGHLGTGGLRC
jgi:uncharacterized circularly permuted ATP-grasp superfamily protein